MRSSLRAISPVIVLLVPVVMLCVAGLRARSASGQGLERGMPPLQIRAAAASPNGAMHDAAPSDAASVHPSATTTSDDAASATEDASAAPTGESSETPSNEPHPRPVYVGIYTFHVPSLDLASNAYLMDFYLWFRWHGNDIDPSSSFEFMNLYEGWDYL
jgi:hypothetical protein